MKILLTGAHFTPAQAVIEELQVLNSQALQDDKIEIVYVGRTTTREGDSTPSVESEVLPKLRVKFVPITAGRIRKVFDIWTIISLLKIPIGFIQAPFILLSENPDVIVSFGGYVAVPVVIWGWLLSKPIIVHEQTLVTGLANSISNLFATKIAVSFKKENSFEGEKIVLTGNPMRKELVEGSNSAKSDPEIRQVIAQAKKEKLPLIYVTGGNQGSHTINLAVSEILPNLTLKAVVIHQTGDSEYQDYEHLLEKQSGLKKPEHYLVRKWIEVNDLAQILKKCDLVVSRAGANTLLELAYFAIPTLVIPLPITNKNEQLQNATFFQKSGLCELLFQSQLNGKNLQKKLEQMLADAHNLKSQAKLAKSVVIEDGAKRLSQEILILAKKNHAQN